MILTLFLINVNIYNSVDAPKDRGISYIEIWILGTQSPIALALFEYGFILYLKRVSKAWSLTFKYRSAPIRCLALSKQNIREISHKRLCDSSIMIEKASNYTMDA